MTSFLMTLKKFSVSEAQEKIAMSIALFMSRGNNLTKVSQKEGLNILVSDLINLLREMGVKDKLQGNRKDSITLHRISICFPEMSVAAAKHFGVSIEHPTLNTVPAQMKTGAFSGLIPKRSSPEFSSEDRNRVILAMVAIDAHRSVQLKGKNHTLLAEDYHRASKFIRTSIENLGVPDKLRPLHMQKIVYSNDALISTIDAAAAMARSYVMIEFVRVELLESAT